MADFTNINTLATFISSSIQSGKSVVIRGFGSFLLRKEPAKLSEDASVLYPPVARVHFISENGGDEESANNAVEEIVELNREGEIASLVRELKRELIERGRLDFPSFGEVIFGESGSFIFEPTEGFMPNSELFTLEKISLKAKQSAGNNERAESSSSQEHSVPVETKEKGSKRVLYILAALLAFILLLIIIFICFKEQLMPLLQELLYSKEELEILKHM